MSNLKCHGAFSPPMAFRSRSVGGFVDDSVDEFVGEVVAREATASMGRPHTGHFPSAVTPDGAK